MAGAGWWWWWWGHWRRHLRRRRRRGGRNRRVGTTIPARRDAPERARRLGGARRRRARRTRRARGRRARGRRGWRCSSWDLAAGEGARECARRAMSRSRERGAEPSAGYANLIGYRRPRFVAPENGGDVHPRAGRERFYTSGAGARAVHIEKRATLSLPTTHDVVSSFSTVHLLPGFRLPRVRAPASTPCGFRPL